MVKVIKEVALYLFLTLIAIAILAFILTVLTHPKNTIPSGKTIQAQDACLASKNYPHRSQK